MAVSEPANGMAAAGGLWVDKHRPLALDKLDYGLEQAKQLAQLVRARGSCVERPTLPDAMRGRTLVCFRSPRVSPAAPCANHPTPTRRPRRASCRT